MVQKNVGHGLSPIARVDTDIAARITVIGYCGDRM
jgi:hypothetical protein